MPSLCELRLRDHLSDVARAIGLKDSAALNTHLCRHRLPRFHELHDWLFVLRLVEEFSSDDSLNAWELRSGIAASSCYKMVERVTGHSWSAVRVLGMSWVIKRALSTTQLCRPLRRRS